MSALTDVHPPTKKRKRMHYACVECNRRKHKCDRKIPCGPCTQRGIAESCRPFEDGDEHGDLRSRLGRVEHLLEGLLAREKAVGAMPVPAPPESTTARSVTSSASERREPEEHEEHLDGGLTGAAGNYFGGNALPSVTSTSIEAEVRGNPNSAQAHSSTISARTTQANLALRQIIAEGGAHPDVLLSLLSELPPKDDIGTLLEIFFRDINPVRFPLPERDIRRAFDELNAFTWGSAREDGDDGASHLIFLPLLFMIIATTTFCLPLCMSKRVDSKTQAKRYYHSYRRAASIASLLPATTTLLYAHMLATRFLIIIRTPADAWSLLGATLRTAQALGLHRDGGRLGLPAPEAERRRRLWAHLFYSDASMCLMLGRPMGVRVGDCDTLPPGQTRLKEDSQDEVADDVRIWDDNPTRWTFVALRHSLSQITSRVVEHFQDLAGGRHYDTVLALDREIVTFYEALPPAYRLDGGEHARETMGERQRGRQTNGRQDSERKGKSRSSDRGTIAESIHPDDAMDGENEADEQPSKPPPYEDPEPGAYPMLPTHRFMINTEVQYVRIALHRPYVLRGGEKYNPSRTACFEAARIDRRAREVFRREVQWPDHRARRDHMGGLYRLFNSTMILGIALLLNPAGPNSAELRGYLDDFIKLHAAQAAHDVTSAREVKIIQLFRAKADDALRLRSPVKSNQGSGTSTPTPQMTREPPNQISHTRHPGARAFSLDSHNAPPFPPSSRTTPPHTSTRIMSPPPGSRRPRSKTSLSSVLIPKSGIDNPPLPPGMSPTTFHPQPFSSPQTTFAVSHHRRSSSASLSPTTPRDAQTLLSPAPRAVSPFLMSGITNSESGTPPTINNPPLAPDNPNTSTPFGQSHDILPFPDDTQALFDQASWQYALANPGSMGLGWDWASGAPPGPSGLGLGLGLGVGELGALDNFGFGFGSGVTGGLGDAGVLGGSDTSASPPTLVVTHAESPEELLAPGTESRVRSGSTGGAKGKAPEGWGYWEGLVDAIGPTARVALAADHHHVYPIYVNIANGSYVCHWCVRTHLQELRAPITKAGAERQVEVERAARLLGGGVEKGCWARAETHTLQESVSAMKAELMARKAANRSAQQRLDKRKRSVADRRDNLHLARELLPPSAAVSFSPTLSPAPSMPTQENTIPFASTSPPTTSRLSRLRHEPPNPTADAKQALADMGDALAETRSVLVRELADAYELQEELRQSAGRDVRMWTMGRMELPTIDDLARQKPLQLHTALYNVLHFMRLTVFYLGVKLPFGVGWGASSTIAPPFPELFIPGSDAGKLETINEDGEGSGIAPIGVGTPWIVASRGLGGSSDGGWGKYGTPLALHLPAHSRDTTSTPKAGLQPAPSSRPHRTESRSSTVPGVPPAPSTPSKRRPGLLSLSRMSAAAKYVTGSAYPSSPRTTATSSHSQTLGGALPTRASLASSSTAPPKTRQRAGSVSIQANPPVRARVASLATAPTRTESLIGEDKEASQGTEPLYNAAYLAWTQGALNVGEVDRVPGILELLGVTVVSEGIGFASHVTSSAQVHALPPPTRSFTLSFPLLLSHNLSQIGGLTSAGLPSHDGDGEWDLIEASEEEDGVG